MLALAGCGETATNTTNSTINTTTANTKENKNSTVPNSPTTTTKSEVESYPPSNLKPESVSLDKPVPAEELRNAVFSWIGKEVAVIGYPGFPRIMGSSVSLKGSADADSRDFKNLLVECRNRQSFENQEVDEKQPIVVRGTIRDYPSAGTENMKVELEDCQVVSKGEFSGEKGAADVTKVDVSKPIPAADLHKDFFKWQGKQVAVVGHYNGHTKSTIKGKTADIRIDVQNDKSEKVVGCHISSEPANEDFAVRGNRTFKGTVAGASFKQVTLEPCEYVKK
jgi:hypothetical protein